MGLEDWVREIVLDRGDGEEESSRELRFRILELPMADGVFASTGCQLWSAAIELAQELLRRPHIVAGKKVVEVGAGCGLLGITIATLARCTLITDGDEECVNLVCQNLKANEKTWRSKEGEAPREASAKVLKWEDAAARAWPLEERAEVVIASDIIAGMFGNVVAQAFLNILAPGGFIMLNAHEDRHSSIRGFRDYLVAAGYGVSESTHTNSHGSFRTYECWARTPHASSKAAPAEPPVQAVAKLQADTPPMVPAEPPADMLVDDRPSSAVADVEPLAEAPAAAPADPLPAVVGEPPCRPASGAPPAPAEAGPSPAVPAALQPVEPADEASPAVVVDPSSLSFQERLAFFKRLGSERYEPYRPQDLRVSARPAKWCTFDPELWSMQIAGAGLRSAIFPGSTRADASKALDEVTVAPADSKIIWHVVGGMKHSGLMVRSGCGLDGNLSSIIGRLAHGALVREVERTALRLHFVRIRGEGPDKGWVSLFSKQGTPLLELVDN